MALTDTLIEEEEKRELVEPRRRTQRLDAPVARSRPRTFELSDDAEMQLKELARSSRPVQRASAEQPKAEKPLGLMGTIREGAKGSLRALGATVDTMQGDAQGVVQAAQEQADAPKDPDLERFYAHIDEQKKALGENPSLFESIGAVGGAAIRNPRGFGLMIAEQLPNSGVALGAAGAGALAGSFAGPFGAAVGGLAGLATANIGLETGSKALEAAADKEFTPEEQSRVRREGLVKGGVITGVDAVTLGATKFITNTSRRAVERATTKALADRGVDITSEAARKAAMKTPEIADAVKEAQELARQGAETLGKRLAVTGGAAALETIGEGAGEYLGELAATGKANAVDAVIEGFAGLGTSIGEIAVTSALNRKGLNRLLDTQEEAEKTAEAETKETGVEHEALPHPKEPEKFIAVPKARLLSGMELERDENGNLKPKAPTPTNTDFNLANRPSFELTAEDKLRKRELERQREDELAKKPIIVPTLAGKPVTQLPIEALSYTVSRGSTRSREIAAKELERRQQEGDTSIPENPADTVTRIVATGAEKAQEDAKKAGVIVPPTPKKNNAAKAVKTTVAPTPETKKAANIVVPETRQAKKPEVKKPEVVTPAATAKVAPAETAKAQPTVKQKEPWEMSSAEWNKVVEGLRPETAQSKFTKSSGTEAVRRIAEGERLRYGVTTEASEKLKAAQKGEIKLSKGELESLTDRLETRVTHADVIKKAIKDGKPVPASVIAEYPELKTTQQKEGAPKSTEAPTHIRQHLDDLIKRRAAAKETGKERSVDNAITRTKELMEGKRTDTALESKWFRVQAAAMRKVDPATADTLSRISESLNAPTDKASTEKPKAKPAPKAAPKSEDSGQKREKPAFSRPKSTAHKNAESVAKAVTGKWKNAPEVVIVEDMDDPAIPEDVRAENRRQLSQGATGEPEGFVAGNKVYIVASQMKTPGDVVRVLLHESLGHFGLRGAFGQELNTVLKQVAALRRSDIEAKAKQYGLDINDEADRLIAAEEVLAELAQTNPKNSLVQRAIAAIRTWLRNNIPGFENISLSDAEIIEGILVPAREFVQSGRTSTVEGRVGFFRSLRSGEETLEKYGLNPGGRYKTREVAAALEARQREKHGLIKRDDRSDKSANSIAEWMKEEVLFEMEHPQKSGVGWYSEKFQRALDVMATEFPEMATDKTARDIFTALIAITSDGQKVVPNFAMAADLYGNFKATGKFTTARGHARQASIDNNLEIIQALHDEMGPERMRDYLMQERTVSELKKIAGETGAKFSTDYQAHVKLPMAAVLLGPKLGAFYANLMGASGYLTMDRWWSRTFNRYRGTLLQAPTRSGLDRFKQLMGNPSMSDDEVLSAVIEPRNAYEAKGFKEGTEIEKAANTLYKAAFENLEDTPFNATDRTFMLKSVALARDKLAQDGIDISVADIQAVLWYYEKRLYGDLGARQTADVSYEEAASKVIEARASAGGSGGRPVPESGTDENLDDTERVGEEDFESLSAEAQAGTTGQVRFSRSASANSATNTFRERFDKIVDSLIYNFQDRFKPLKDIQKRAGPVAEDEDAALAEERYSGMVRARVDTFEDQMRDPLLKAIHDSGVSYEEVEEYLHALHAPSRNAAMKEINPTEAELKAQVSALEKQRDTLAKDKDVERFVKLRRELRQAQADVEDGIADESLVRGLQSDIAQIRRQQNVKDYAEALDKLKALRLVKPFKGDNTALSGMSNDQAKAILDKADKNGTRAKLDKVSSIVDSITQRTRQIYVDSGLEKADTINAWNQKYEHYVPLHRDEVGGNTMPKVGQGFNIRGKESKRATGSTKAVTDILAHVVAQHEAAIIRSEKARVDRALFQFASTHPDPSLWTLDSAPMLRTVDPVSGLVVERVDPTYKNRPEVLTLKIDGQEHTITFTENNPEAMRLAASMKNLASSELGEVTQMVGKFTRFLATMNTTANPVFVARNFMRDLQTTYINLSDTALAQKKAEVFRDIPAAIKGMWNLSRGKGNSQWAKYAQEFKAAGGQTGWMEHYKDIGTRADALRKELSAMQPGKLNTARKAFRSLRDIVNDANNAVENGARLAAYVNARRSGISEGKAAQLAKNLTVNFNARGAKSVELNAWYMFMNASIQGTARLAKAMSNRQVRKIVAGIILSGFLMDVMARAMAGDDDEDGENDYDQLPEHTKSMNFVFMVGGQPVTIPMPYGYNFFASTGRKISEMIFRENYSPVKSAADLASVFLGAFSPVGQAGSGLQFVAPTVADPFIQWAENKNFAGNPLRKEQNQFGPPHPEYQMGFKSTSAPAKWLAEMLNDTTGGNEVRPGFVNVNPVFFDFSVSSIAGGAGRTYLQILSGPLKAVGDDEIQAREIPFANIFVGARPEYQTERKYFEAVEDVETAVKELTTYRQKGDMEMVKEIREERGNLIRLQESAKATKELLARLRKRDLALDKQELPNKLELRREIEEKKREAMSRFNKKYREAVIA